MVTRAFPYKKENPPQSLPIDAHTPRRQDGMYKFRNNIDPGRKKKSKKRTQRFLLLPLDQVYSTLKRSSTRCGKTKGRSLQSGIFFRWQGDIWSRSRKRILSTVGIRLLLLVRETSNVFFKKTLWLVSSKKSIPFSFTFDFYFFVFSCLQTKTEASVNGRCAPRPMPKRLR